MGSNIIILNIIIYTLKWLLWSEKILDMISIFLNLLMFDLWPKMWSIMENVPCALVKKKMYPAAFVWNVHWYQLSSSVLICHFKASISLLIFCLDDLSIGKNEVLKSPTIIVLLLISPQINVSICLIYWSTPMLDVYINIFIIIILSS